MLEAIFNTKNKEKVLFFLFTRKEGYAREIARYYNSSLSPIQNQLEKLEFRGILASKSIGKTRVYFYNTRYPFFKELVELIKKAIDYLPQEEKDNLIMKRTRPRRKGKPL
jgi:hypothetical protein